MDAFVDSKELIDTWEGQGSRRSPELTSVTKELFFFFFCPLSVLSGENTADGPSQRLSSLDSRLAGEAWERVEKAF